MSLIIEIVIADRILNMDYWFLQNSLSSTEWICSNTERSFSSGRLGTNFSCVRIVAKYMALATI